MTQLRIDDLNAPVSTLFIKMIEGPERAQVKGDRSSSSVLSPANICLTLPALKNKDRSLHLIVTGLLAPIGVLAIRSLVGINNNCNI